MPDHLHAIVWMHEGFVGSIKMVARGYAQGCSKVARGLSCGGVSVGGDAQWDCAKDMNTTRGGEDEDTTREGKDEDTASEGEDEDTTREGKDEDTTREGKDVSEVEAAKDPYDCGNGAHTLFEPPFVRTLSRKGQLDRMVKYVKANPDNAWRRKLNPDLYVIRRNVVHGGLRFDTMGKARLLDYPEKNVVALSRSLSPEQIDHEVKSALMKAEAGMVTMTAAVNEGERAVSKAVREAGYPLVVMLLDGFPPEGSEAARYYHPGGGYHKVCGEGRLYLMAPMPENYNNPQLIARTDAEIKRKDEEKGYVYRAIPHTSKRWRMIAGNMMLSMLLEI